MKNRGLTTIIFLGIFSTLFAQKYYYYAGEKVPLCVSDSIDVYSYPIMNSREFDERLVQIQTIHKNQVLDISKNAILSKEYIINDSAICKMSNHFYVKLRSLSDYQTLHQLAENTHVIVLGEVPYMNKWYDLMVNNSLFDNSLDMSNYFYETGLFEDIDPGFVFNFRPNCVTDERYSWQWALPKIHACQAWNITTSSSSIKIAIVDMGIETTHDEFTNTNFGLSYDCEQKTSPASVYYNYNGNRNVYHGMLVAGVIAADHNHANIAGLSPNVTVMSASHSLIPGNHIGAELASGISWAFNNGADIINCSWGDQGGKLQKIHSPLLEDAIDSALVYGREGKGCVIVFAAGNHGAENLGIDYPGNAFPDILVVGATNSNDSKTTMSAYGSALDVMAPGHNIYTTEHNNSYISEEGTSLAAPHVSAIAGLVLSANPSLTQKQVADIIESTSQKIGSYTYSNTFGRPNGTWNNYVGYGLVDAYAAVKEAIERHLQNKTYASGTSIVEYYPEIFAGYSVTNAVPYGNVVVKSGSNVTFKATDAIRLRSGFRVEKGANFRAYIEPVSQPSSPAPSMIRDNDNEECVPTGINTVETSAKNSFAVFPNPATDHVAVSSTEPIAQTMLYNLNGQLVLQTSETEIDVSALSAGVYIVHAQTSSGQLLTAKFVHL